MPAERPTQATDAWDGDDAPAAPSRRVARYAVPAAVAGVAALTIGLVPALASSGSPDLPDITAEQLIAKMADSDTQRLSGTVKISTDLGLPALPGAASGGAFGGGGPAHEGGDGRGGDEGGSAADPQAKLMELASGTHTLRVAADGPEKQRVSIVGDAAEYSLIHNGDDVWGYDSGSDSAYHATAPEHAAEDGGPKGPADITPQEFAEQALKAVGDSTAVTVDGTAKVAGRDAYQLVIEPKAQESTVGSVRIAVDADNGVPLKFTLTPKSGGAAAIDAGFTSVDFGEPDPELFEFTPPKGTDVTEQQDLPEKGLDKKAEGKLPVPGGADGLSGLKVIGEDWTSVAELKAPGGAKGPGGEAGLPAEAEQLLDSLGDKVSGDFGTGRVFSTRLVNVLLTDDGAVYAGAVDKGALIKAADQAK